MQYTTRTYTGSHVEHTRHTLTFFLVLVHVRYVLVKETEI